MGGRLRIMHTHCRVAYGSVLCATGRWPEAEAQLIDALGPAGSPAIAHRPLAIAHLADLRLDQGRVDEAADLLAPFEDWVYELRARWPVSTAPVATSTWRPPWRGGACPRWWATPCGRRRCSRCSSRSTSSGATSTRRRAAADELARRAAVVDLAAVQALADVADGRVRMAGGDPEGARRGVRRRQGPPGRRGRTRWHWPPCAWRWPRRWPPSGETAAAIDEARAALACFDRLGARART